MKQKHYVMPLYNTLTHQTPKLPSERNQSIDLRNKSIDWFLYKATLAFDELMVYGTNRSYEDHLKLCKEVSMHRQCACAQVYVIFKSLNYVNPEFRVFALVSKLPCFNLEHKKWTTNQQAFTCSKSSVVTPGQCVNYV